VSSSCSIYFSKRSVTAFDKAYAVVHAANQLPTFARVKDVLLDSGFGPLGDCAE